MKLPSDAGPLEEELLDLIVRGVYEPKTSSYIYALLDDPLDKFLLCFVFELGKTRREAEIATGYSKATLWKRIKKVKCVVEGYARENNKLKPF